MFTNFFERRKEAREIIEREENRKKSLYNYKVTAQFAADEAAKTLKINPSYLERHWWNIPVYEADTVLMARLAGKYPLWFPTIRKLYTGEKPMAGEISWTSEADRLQKLEILKQCLRDNDERMAVRIAANPEMINELNEIDWYNLPNKLKSFNDIYYYASAYKFRFPEYAYAYTGIRFPTPEKGQTFEEAWARLREKQLQKEAAVKKRKGR